MQLLGERRRHRAAGDRLQLARDAVAVERLEVDPQHHRTPRELREQQPQRMAGRQLARAERERHGDPLVTQVAGQERDQVAR